MGLASDIRDMVSERGDKSFEFAGEGYRLSLNPIEDRWTEIGFILWREEADGAQLPAATGRVVGDEVRVSEAGGFPGSGDDLTALLGRLVRSEPIAVAGSGRANEQAIPTGGVVDAPGWPTTDAAETGDAR